VVARKFGVTPTSLSVAMLRAARLIGLALGLLAAAAAPTALAQQATIRDSEAASHVGEDVTVEGITANVHTSRAGNTFLNFGRAYPNQTFTAAVFRSAAGQFSCTAGKGNGSASPAASSCTAAGQRLFSRTLTS